MQREVREIAEPEARSAARAPEVYEYFSPVETHLIRSKHVAQTFKIQVMRPARKKGESRRFPVVYATDGNLTFDMLKGISHIIQASERDSPRFVLVGIGYPSDSPRGGAILRGRDLLFPGYPALVKPHHVADGVLVPEKGTKDAYGAEDFRNFIEHELIPLIDEEYETVPGDRTYFGHSAGGGFGLFTLFTRPELFRNYVISSPGLIYHGRSADGTDYDHHDFVLQYARRFVASGRVLDRVKMYMSVASEEEFEPAIENWHITSSFYRMVALLRKAGISGLSLSTEVFQGETHMTVWPSAFIHGLQSVFNTGPRRLSVQTVAS